MNLIAEPEGARIFNGGHDPLPLGTAPEECLLYSVITLLWVRHLSCAEQRQTYYNISTELRRPAYSI